ncbi:phosphotransferase [Longimicrobium sp.]|uniref:phosphotransferase n=1 Tax=Longimicrobium sp. TaxID=2029185 RepID=UPI002E30E708|nr:phosphotransferase [Longimicrobium sp.]HEX6037434.1 phosphotransferase [Longimicrobium sp.]
MNLDDCLPAELRGPDTTITRIAQGLSGAGVHRVDAGGRAFVLKVSAPGEPLDAWRGKLHVQQLAADAGVAPRVVHEDEARRAVVSEFVAGAPFFALYGNPQTRGAAITLLGQTLRRVHAIPLPTDARPADPRAFLVDTWTAVRGGMAIPEFAREMVQGVLAEEAPARGGAPVLSHNDVNPSNFVLDGERLVLLDWDTAAPNDPFFDLATVSVFLRMDGDACRQLLAAYEGEPVDALPAGFAYNRRLVAALAGANFLDLARRGGHPGATGGETAESPASLADIYQRMRAGELNIAGAEGQWAFGLALMKEGLAT